MRRPVGDAVRLASDIALSAGAEAVARGLRRASVAPGLIGALGFLLDMAALALAVWFAAFASAIDAFDPWRWTGLAMVIALVACSILLCLGAYRLKTTMTQLSDTQAQILSAAAQRPEHIALPLLESLRGGAAAKVVGAMLAKGFLEEVDADIRKGEPVWRETGDGHGVTLVATDAGLAAIGIESEDANTSPAGATGAPTEEPAEDASTETAVAPGARTPRAGTKQAALIAMLRAPDGATIEQIMAATGWQSHTVRGAFARSLKKKLRLEITSDKVEGRGRVYRIIT